jgi:Ulp1 family protease
MLNDNIVNDYFALRRSAFTTAEFKPIYATSYALKEILESTQAPALDVHGHLKGLSQHNFCETPVIIIPVYHQMKFHWSLAIVVPPERTVLHYNSIRNLEDTSTAAVVSKWLFKNAAKFLDGTVQTDTPEVLQQDRDRDCGVWICYNAARATPFGTAGPTIWCPCRNNTRSRRKGFSESDGSAKS